MSYEPHDMLTDRARHRGELWRTLAGIAFLGVATTALMALWVLALSPLRTAGGPGEGPGGIIWILASFICPLIALAVVMQVLHRRSFLTLIGPFDLAGRQFLKVLGVQAGVMALALVLPSPGGLTPVANLDTGVWLRWLVLALLLLALQVGTEELVFRGYLQSQLAVKFRSPLIWLVVPAVLFAVLHLDPTAGGNRWPVVGITLLFALSVGDLTARAGTLGPALAMHFVNNFGALMLVGVSGPMEGLALYVFPTRMSDPALLPSFALEALLIVIAWLGARIVLRR